MRPPSVPIQTTLLFSFRRCIEEILSLSLKLRVFGYVVLGVGCPLFPFPWCWVLGRMEWTGNDRQTKDFLCFLWNYGAVFRGVKVQERDTTDVLARIGGAVDMLRVVMGRSDRREACGRDKPGFDDGLDVSAGRRGGTGENAAGPGGWMAAQWLSNR